MTDKVTRMPGRASDRVQRGGTLKLTIRSVLTGPALCGAAVALLISAGPVQANEETPMIYPDTRQTGTAEEHFGITVADPFRWLENDPRQDAEVARWVEAQNALSAPYLAGLAGRDVFQRRLTAIFDQETWVPPIERNGLYFFTRNSGLDNQAQLVVREGSEGANRTLIDPNTWSEDGTVALAEWAPSADGTHLAFAMQDGGTDWRTIRVMNTSTAEMLDDAIEWARFTTIAWAGDGSGFYYSRFPEPEAGAAFTAGIDGHAIYFHALGTPQSEDRLVHASPPGAAFIQTPEVYLIEQGITPPDGLAIHGESNGGLLVGAVVNQRPDLFAAALPGVGVLDMLRFDRFTSGAMWVEEFGSPAVEVDFHTLLAYSPLHTIREGAHYPAILTTTADTDNRVVPAHSFKYVATLQDGDIGPRPHLLRVETRAGHGAGKPTYMVIEEIADMWAFAAEWTGLDVADSD